MTFSRRNSALEPEEKEQGIDGIKMIIDTGFIQLRYTDVLGKFLAKNLEMGVRHIPPSF